MAKHRKKQYYRRMVIAAVAMGAVGIPSAAMACVDWPGKSTDQSDSATPYAGAGSPSETAAHHRWEHRQRHHHRGHHRNLHKAATPAPVTSKTPSAAPSTPKATRPVQPRPTASAAAPRPTASATHAAASTPKATATASGVVARIVQLVNAERAKVGCSALTLNATLTKVAQAHSQDMAAHQNMSHTGSDGSDPGQRITRGGYAWSAYGENVAYGYATPEQVMAGWMSSPGHRANILNCSFKEIGVGLAQPNSYWTQDFGTAR
ncbi:CAP domain-containing protein [Streptomyces sp. NPDC007971]|uniref:CAP domain-containing protein n=1 Tax=Streptomyces sp. NPDC007971 TaxID=3364799 RepID=UPI0036EA1582